MAISPATPSSGSCPSTCPSALVSSRPRISSYSSSVVVNRFCSPSMPSSPCLQARLAGSTIATSLFSGARAPKSRMRSKASSRRGCWFRYETVTSALACTRPSTDSCRQFLGSLLIYVISRKFNSYGVVSQPTTQALCRRGWEWWVLVPGLNVK